MTDLTPDDLVDSQYELAEEYDPADEDPFLGLDGEPNGADKANSTDRPKRHRLTPIPFRDMQAVTAGKYIVKNIIPAGGLTVIWGPPKSGKSFWTTDVFLHVAQGWTYRGHKVKAGAVVYVAAEGGSGFGARIEAFRCHHDLPADADPPFYVVPARVELIGDQLALIGEIRAALGEQTPVAVVIDTLNRSLRGSESKDEDMTAYIAAADAIREALGCAVVVIHHCGIEGSRPRGHTSLTGAADAQIAVSRTAAKLIRTEIEWQKDGPGEGDTTTSQLQVVEVGTDEDGEPVTSCVITEAEATAAAPSTGPKRSANQRTMFSILHDAGPHGLPLEDWNTATKEAGIGKGRRATLYDIRTALKAAGLVHTTADRWYAKQG